MQMKSNKRAPGRARAALALLTIAALLSWAGPASARLDELIREDAPYITPPAAELTVTHSLYEVKDGDTLTCIAQKKGISLETLAAANGLADRDKIRAGQCLTIPYDYFIHYVQPGETMWEISRMYHVEVADLSARNRQTDVDKILVGQRLLVPCQEAGRGGHWTTSRGFAASQFSWPLVGAITSPFGPRDGRLHEGIDIAAEEGTPIRAAAAGRVVFAGPRGTYGLAVIIDHGGQVRTLYAHCSKVLVAEGASVGPSTIIALAGNTGNSRGPHLHLEILKNGVPQDPLMLLEQERYYG
ncbi:MAG: Murein DD-endopeptidase MepM [Firmicutes bacterium ADurb.Bin456]|nr:MAG: Murein DD-endopeptidase MepM [Firmicutes bacterium ADurb.Bin456]